MRTEQVSIYKFDELSDDAKEKAREWYRDGALDYEWWDGVYADADRVLKLLGVERDDIYFSGFWSQGDGACFTGSYAYKAGSVRAMYRYAPQDAELNRIALELMLVQRSYQYSIEASITHHGHYHHEHSVSIDVGAHHDMDRDDEETVAELLRDLMRWIYRRLEQEHDWLLSDEQVDESIIANEYEFTEDGERA